jgi:hypothetical protein
LRRKLSADVGGQKVPDAPHPLLRSIELTGSAYDMLDASSLHGLHLKKQLKMPLTAQDLAPVIHANPGMIPDEATRDLVLEILEGKHGATRGRPKKSIGHQGMLVWANIEIEDRAREIREARKLRPAGEKHIKGELEPMAMAADEIAPVFSMTGRALLNAISAQKSRPYLSGM